MPKARLTLARRADPHVCYEKAVQCPEAEIDFVDKTFRKLRKRTATRLREDFCGTAALCCEWVRRRPANTAVGLDLDQPTLDWGTAHHIAGLRPAARDRVKLLRRNVMTPGPGTAPMDAILAMNFSYWVFKERDTLRRYFKLVRRDLARDGIFYLDVYGGWETMKEQRDRRQIGRGRSAFTYIWDQEKCDPITHELLAHIHFRFRDGSMMRKAFTYDWRAWTVPELVEILAEAGFKRTIVYWEGEDRKGEGNGVFTPATHGESCPAFISYITAEK